MIMRMYKDNVKEIAHLALECLWGYKHYRFDFLDHNHIDSLLKAKGERIALDEHIWDLCVISKKCDKEFSGEIHNENTALIQNYHENKHYLKIKTQLMKIVGMKNKDLRS